MKQRLRSEIFRLRKGAPSSKDDFFLQEIRRIVKEELDEPLQELKSLILALQAQLQAPQEEKQQQNASNRRRRL